MLVVDVESPVCPARDAGFAGQPGLEGTLGHDRLFLQVGVAVELVVQAEEGLRVLPFGVGACLTGQLAHEDPLALPPAFPSDLPPGFFPRVLVFASLVQTFAGGVLVQPSSFVRHGQGLVVFGADGEYLGVKVIAAAEFLHHHHLSVIGWYLHEVWLPEELLEVAEGFGGGEAVVEHGSGDRIPTLGK